MTRADEVGFTPLGRHRAAPGCKSEWGTEGRKKKKYFEKTPPTRLTHGGISGQLSSAQDGEVGEHTAPPAGGQWDAALPETGDKI